MVCPGPNPVPVEVVVSFAIDLNKSGVGFPTSRFAQEQIKDILLVLCALGRDPKYCSLLCMADLRRFVCQSPQAYLAMSADAEGGYILLRLESHSKVCYREQIPALWSHQALSQEDISQAYHMAIPSFHHPPSHLLQRHSTEQSNLNWHIFNILKLLKMVQNL